VGYCVVHAALAEEGGAEVAIALGAIRVDLEERPVFDDGVIEAALQKEDIGEIAVAFLARGHETEVLTVFGDGFIEAPCGRGYRRD